MSSPPTRPEKDSLGTVLVPADRYWGAQTQRSLENFAIAGERMPPPLIHALGLIKQAAARANAALGNLEHHLADAIAAAAAEVAAGQWDEHFPLVVWQTGSGTQTNMNANEVIAHRANELLGGRVGDKAPVHPNDHVNRAQSSNDVFPAAMHVAAMRQTVHLLLPALRRFQDTLARHAAAWSAIIKVGRTHLQDATPITLGQEFSGYAAQTAQAAARIEAALTELYALPLGGTAVGTGLNAPAGFDTAATAALAELSGLPFTPAANKFAAIAGHDALVAFSGALNALAATLLKIANDIRLLGSGPRTGIGELRLPANEPGSSIMPGKANPTQAEALTMIACEVMGNHVAVTIAGSQGHLELNAYKPVIIWNVLRSIRLLADGAASFEAHCLRGLTPDLARIDEHLGRSLMLVTALAPAIGYDQAAKVAQHAHAQGISLRQAALDLQAISAEAFDELVRPEAMIGPTDPP